MDLGSLLLKACQNGQKEVTRKLLTRDGVSINQKDNLGYTPLHYACKKGYFDIVKLLLDNGAEVNIFSRKEITPLQLAAANGNKNVIKILIEAGAKIDAQDKAGKTALIHGIEAKKIEAVRYLVELGADITLADKKDKTPFYYANELGLFQLVDILSHGETYYVDELRNTTLHQACENGKTEMVKMILQKNEVYINEVNLRHETPLFLAVKKGNIVITQLLLQAGANPDIGEEHGVNPLMLAIFAGNVHLVNELLNYNADFGRNASGFYPLKLAVVKGRKDIVSLLLDKGANVKVSSVGEMTMLEYAREKGYKEIEELLLERGAK